MTEQVPHTPVAMHYTRSGHAHKQGGGQAYFLAMTFLVFALFSSAVNAATISSGYSGMWYDPARSGEGLQLEILSPEFALVEWYTYDSQGKQRWIQGVGNIAGNSIQFPQAYVTQGGKFGPAFNKDDVKTIAVGSLSLTFGDCNTGTFKYSAFGQSQTLPIQRLTQTMGGGCAPINGVPGQPVMPYAGQSGSWYNPSRSGEGFDLQWLANGAALVTWYTYDANGNQVWLLGVGNQQGNAIVFDQMAITNGPKFGAAYNKADLQQEDWGSLTLTLDCNGGTGHYASKQAAYGSGDLTLTRLTHLQQPACPYVQPKLGELYDITWDELPIEIGTPQNPNYLSAESIANDGTVAGRRAGHLALWHPDTRTWEDIPLQLQATPVAIAPDGMVVIATEENPDSSVHAVMWQRSTGWQRLLGDALSQSGYSAVSHNFQYVAGTGQDANGHFPAWVLPMGGVQQLLPKTDAVPLLTPLAISNNGNIIIGTTLRFPTSFPKLVAARWDSDGSPMIIHDPDGEELAVASSCDAECRIVFGAGLYNYDPSHPHPGEAWLLKSDGMFEYFGALSDALVTARSYAVVDATTDGSLAVGTYQTNPPSAGYPAATVSRAFVWTETTGIVSVRSLVDVLGIGDDDWDEMSAVRVSPDGLKILLGGTRRLDLHPDGQPRAVVLELMPKAASN
ncbi:MAG TPA: hypothetical protein PKD77_07070 [Rudaea sp.]|nr:hypothetical protein [Rudaea sp.]